MVGGVLCEVQKAFDCVDHDIFLFKLEFYGLAGKACILNLTLKIDTRE
jgi:hypothetical protein